MIGNVFVELSLVIIVALVITAVMRLLKQPSIVGYLLTGIIVGPFLFNLIGSEKGFEPFAQIGISLLLFSVGLNLNPKAIRNLGKVATITGVGQLLFTFITGYFAAVLLGFSSISSVYIALALSFSSTIVIMKFLSDREENETLHGRITIGFLIIQDIVHVIALIILLTVSSAPIGASINSVVMGSLWKVLSLGAILLVVSVYVLPAVMKRIARSQEMLLFFAIGWALAISALFQHEAINFSMEVGALLAGVTLSVSPFRFEISSKLKPLRDFFLLIFFIWLAFLMGPINLWENLGKIIAFSVIVLVGAPLIIMILMGALGYTKRNSFLTGLYVSQISEFSFIITALGVSLGHVSSEILSLVIVVGLVTIVGSSYGITHSRKLYNILAEHLSIFERKTKKVDEGKFHVRNDHEVILFGYNRIGFDLLKSLGKKKRKALVVDYNPATILKLARRGIDSRYGDANDLELLEDLNFKHAKMIISTIPDKETNLLLISKLKRINKNTIFIVIAHHVDDALELYNMGATYVIMPHFLGGVHTADLIEKYDLSKAKFQNEKIKSLKELRERRREGHEHPRHERS
jgi:Kef-type K+ transport system membrane component KefB/Trk K+ transport system NAD-binding subunit